MSNDRSAKYILVVENAVNGEISNIFQGYRDELVIGQQHFEYTRGKVAYVVPYDKWMTDYILSTVDPDNID